jgi:tetratricopeptide (TPR) repeat protein
MMPLPQGTSDCVQADEPSVRGRFTIAELSRLLGASPARLRHWMRQRLIVPVEPRRPASFDYVQVRLARRLNELIDRRASLTAIRRNLAQLRARMPDEDSPLSRVAEIQRCGRLLIRRDDGLVDVVGQRHFDFSDDEEPSIRVLERRASGPTLDEQFAAALELEDAGRLSEAEAAYHEALTLAPDDAAIHFNLGNVQWRLGRIAECIASYRQAVRLDPHYAEARHNLGLAARHLHWSSPELASQ